MTIYYKSRDENRLFALYSSTYHYQKKYSSTYPITTQDGYTIYMTYRLQVSE